MLVVKNKLSLPYCRIFEFSKCVAGVQVQWNSQRVATSIKLTEQQSQNEQKTRIFLTTQNDTLNWWTDAQKTHIAQYITAAACSQLLAPVVTTCKCSAMTHARFQLNCSAADCKTFVPLDTVPLLPNCKAKIVIWGHFYISMVSNYFYNFAVKIIWRKKATYNKFTFYFTNSHCMAYKLTL